MSNNNTFEEKSITYEKSLDGDFKKNKSLISLILQIVIEQFVDLFKH